MPGWWGEIDMQNLEFLYHYTSLDSLEKILENRTLRLSPLTQMDDLEEKEIEDLKILASFCYVSSWTYESDEKERMWEMYGDHKEGVRIGMRVLPFQTYSCTEEERKIIEGLGLTRNYDEMYVSVEDMIRGGFITGNQGDLSLFRKIKYTDDVKKRIPKIYSKKNRKRKISLYELGVYKNRSWEYQDEARYIIIHSRTVPAVVIIINSGWRRALCDCRMTS